MRKKSSQRAMTLIEMLFVCLLLALLIGVLAELLQWGLRSHQKGEAARQAGSYGRDLVNHLVTELATSVALQPYTPDTAAGITSDFQSALLWPDPYGPNAPLVTFSDPFYLRERVNSTLPSGQPVPIDRVHNRMIFSRPGTSPGPNFNANDYSQFVYVEYLVVPADANGLGQNVLYRRLYQCAPSNGQPPVGVNLSGDQRTILTSFFLLDPTNPLGNVNMLNSSASAQVRLEQCLINQLPHSSDQITFTVDHAQYISPTGLAPPQCPAFDANLFTVTMNVSIGLSGGYLSQGQFMATQVYSADGRVRTGG